MCCYAALLGGIGGPNTESQSLCMAVSLSYFIYDLIYCAVVGDLESVFHHMFTIGGASHYEWRGLGGGCG